MTKDLLWYKDAVIYQLHVKAFSDSNEDGIGDFAGLCRKLDYLEDLGVTAIWVLPFYPSPLKDDGYDIADYYNINSDYGTLSDFKKFLKEAHDREIRVITELVINHTSDQHPWFQRARREPKGSMYRDYYVWSDTPDRYSDARIIFKDFESSNWAWDPVSKSYYWHRFYSHQPDLNFENPQVQKAVMRAMDFWFDMGVDGLRLDAIPYLFEREGTNCENLPETYEFLRVLRGHLDKKYEGKLFLAEANQWPEDAVGYFGQGDICHMAFHFPVMPRIFMAVQMEDRFPIIDILRQTPDIPESCQWAMFLRNHDELTLEMVTDEERDYMYRVYAKDTKAKINLGIRRRLAPLLDNNRRKIELMNMLLFSLPGTPIVYYGDEIGMGDNYYLGDRNGVRTPMQWSSDRNGGFSQANPQRLFLPVIIDPDYHYEAVNVDHQVRNTSSLLWWMKRVIAMRKQYAAFGRGRIEFLPSDNAHVLSFIRQHEDEIVLVIANLSRFSQAITLDLAQYNGFVPMEVFSQNYFPVIRRMPYSLTLGPHGSYWLHLRKETKEIAITDETPALEISITKQWHRPFDDKLKKQLLKKVLPDYIKRCRWFGGKTYAIKNIRVSEDIVFVEDNFIAHLIFLDIQYQSKPADTYLLPLSLAWGDKPEQQLHDSPRAIIAKIIENGEEAILYDSLYDERFRIALYGFLLGKKRLKGSKGDLHVAHPGKSRQLLLKDYTALSSKVLTAEQSNSSICYGEHLIFKFFRRLDVGFNPDYEVTSALTQQSMRSNVPRCVAALNYQSKGQEPVVLGFAQEYVPNEGNVWTFALEYVRNYLERVSAGGEKVKRLPRVKTLIETPKDLPSDLQGWIGGVILEMIPLLAQRTAEMHHALANVKGNPDFMPESFTMLYQRSVYQSIRTGITRLFDDLKQKAPQLPKDIRKSIREVSNFEAEFHKRIAPLTKKKITAAKIRIHGDFHLGQVLFTGNDFVIIDFEGEPVYSVSERRLKRSPLRDVAGMIRSFHYVAHAALEKWIESRPEDSMHLTPWVELWYRCVKSIYWYSYCQHIGAGTKLIPQNTEERQVLLDAFLISKVIYELGYELNHRPHWIKIPISGIRSLLASSQRSSRSNPPQGEVGKLRK